jgi:thymidylate kinase
MSMKCIILGGDVGGGKTTHSHLIRKYLSINGFKSKYFYVKTTQLFSRILLYFIIFLINPRYYVLFKKYSPIRILKNIKPDILKRIFPLYSFLNLVDTMILLFVRQRLYGLINYVLVFEDHIIGFMNDYIYFTRIYPGRNSFWLRVTFRTYYKYAAKCKPLLFLKTSIHDLYRRYKVRGSIPETYEYIVCGRIAYKVLKNLLEINIVDTSRPISSVFSEVKSLIEKQFL